MSLAGRAWAECKVAAVIDDLVSPQCVQSPRVPAFGAIAGIMRPPSTAALLVLTSICYDTTICLANAQQETLKEQKSKDKYKAACPAYEHYARFSQYGQCLDCRSNASANFCLANHTAEDQ